MEAEERPSKLQKTEHEAGDSPVDVPMSKVVQDPSNNDDKPKIDAKSEGCTQAAIDTAIGAAADQTQQPTLSKNQLKKLAKQRRWEDQRERRKEYRKEKLQKKRERSKALKAELQASGVALIPGVHVEGILPDKNKIRREARARAVNVPLTFIIDCNFDELMHDTELKSLSSQITRSYSDNAKAAYRASLVIASFHGKLKERFDTVLSKNHENWIGVKITQDDFATAAESSQLRMHDIRHPNLKGAFADKSESGALKEEGEVVYLTSDSPNTLTELKPYSTYIIGGIVDKNRHKGICYQRALDKGMKTAKLPIGDYMQMTSRFVLATNHVMEIMLKWLELKDWGKAFSQVMPKRKGGRLKSEVSTPASSEAGYDTHPGGGEVLGAKSRADADDAERDDGEGVEGDLRTETEELTGNGREHGGENKLI
ncbi:tRNA (guanine(9)-N1)-methyltransferase [Trichophyton mentagrophytes]|uniref:tRNA (guanine(9)-N1)-methyltransferase n=1 Tax=Trichophyton interdigitale (strain MR816) TaxID=1215338 RepID=A0A059JFG9_TRIIM|nr:hypothetical protein H101_02988 [Trichophyton interdigitale H6]KDB26626.1 hypothetical protein H109_01588 [Trichophyton interdigitale MR816]GBF62966.1 tRNA (guanine(9)-N1)-methyltransferase [Trichophyton mentagrophytes]